MIAFFALACFYQTYVLKKRQLHIECKPIILSCITLLYHYKFFKLLLMAIIDTPFQCKNNLMDFFFSSLLKALLLPIRVILTQLAK